MELKHYHGYNSQLIIYNTEGESFLKYPTICKSHIKDAIAKYLWPNDIKSGPDTYGELDMNNVFTGIFIRKERFGVTLDNARNIMGQIEAQLGIKKSNRSQMDAGFGDNVGRNFTLITRPASWWLLSPISLSAYFLFLKIIAHRSKVHQSPSSMIDYALSNRHVGKIPFGESQNYVNLAAAVRRGNYDGLIAKSLPCLASSDYSDYLLNTHYRGFATYSKSVDARRIETNRGTNDVVSE